MNKKQKRLFKLILSAILCAISIVLSRFLSLNVWNMSIGISFLPIMLCALVCGPLWSGIAGALADFIGALLFTFGTYFPGFTAVAFLSGIFFGLVGVVNNTFKKRGIVIALTATTLLAKELLCSLFLNSLWISILYGTAYKLVLASRIPVSAVMFGVETVSALIICNFILPNIRKELK